MNIKTMGTLILIISLAVAISAGCIDESMGPSTPDTIKETPTAKIDNSLERELINKWLAEVGDPNNVMWLYVMGENGQLIAEYPVVGKPVSMTKSNEPKTRVLDTYNAGPDYSEVQSAKNFLGYRQGTEELANPSGTYGGDLPGVFIFTPDGEYHEFHGGILHISSVPVMIKDQVFLSYDVDKEKQEKEKQWEAQLRKNNPIVEKAKKMNNESVAA
jgi:hypothetical protein